MEDFVRQAIPVNGKLDDFKRYFGQLLGAWSPEQLAELKDTFSDSGLNRFDILYPELEHLSYDTSLPSDNKPSKEIAHQITGTLLRYASIVHDCMLNVSHELPSFSLNRLDYILNPDAISDIPGCSVLTVAYFIHGDESLHDSLVERAEGRRSSLARELHPELIISFKQLLYATLSTFLDHEAEYRIASRVLDIPVNEPLLQRARVRPISGEIVALADASILSPSDFLKIELSGGLAVHLQKSDVQSSGNPSPTSAAMGFICSPFEHILSLLSSVVYKENPDDARETPSMHLYEGSRGQMKDYLSGVVQAHPRFFSSTLPTDHLYVSPGNRDTYIALLHLLRSPHPHLGREGLSPVTAHP